METSSKRPHAPNSKMMELRAPAYHAEPVAIKVEQCGLAREWNTPARARVQADVSPTVRY